MSKLYGLHPWDEDRLTDGELDDYLDDLEAELKRANG